MDNTHRYNYFILLIPACRVFLRLSNGKFFITRHPGQTPDCDQATPLTRLAMSIRMFEYQKRFPGHTKHTGHGAGLSQFG
jgi:hypothetical protein